MKAIVKSKPEPGVELLEVDKPTPLDGELLVKVKYASICGTDVGIYNWDAWAQEHMTPPTIIGHEVVGEILEINSDDTLLIGDLKIGDLVSSETHIFDGTCFQCTSNHRHICENMSFFGYGRDGCFAEYATIPIRTTWKNDASIPIKAMSVQEPLGNSVNVVSKAHVAGKRVLIMGLGPTGLCAAAVANIYGAHEVIAVDPSEYRRNLAEKFTSVKTYASYSQDMNDTFDVVLEMSGAIPAIQNAFDAVRIAGTIIAFGIPKEDVLIPWRSKVISKEIYIKSVFGRKIWETWHETSNILRSGKINLEKIITHEFTLDAFEDAMSTMKSGESGKILLKI